MINKIDFDKAHEIMTKEKEYIIVDVREEDEYITGHAVDAMLFPVDEINEKTATQILPNKKIPLLVYCRSGRRSAEAAIKLDSYGYEQIYDIGSLIGWPYGME